MSKLLQTASSAGQTIPLVPIVHVGQIVHFVLPDGPEAVHGHCRPAIVTNVKGHINLMVVHDYESEEDTFSYRIDMPYDPTHAFGSWHPIDQCRVRP